MKRTTLALFAATFLAATPAGAATIWALDAAGGLARIDTDSLRAMPAMAIKGTDGAVLSVALRPANGKLYGLTAKGQLVTIDPASGMASEVARLDKPMALGARTTINFNPLVDRLRVVSSNGGNWRVHPDTGAVIVDGGLKYAANSVYAEAMPMVTTGAYSHHVAGTKETALYTLDTKLGLMNVQMPPNDGVQQPKGRLNIAVPANAGFDILTDAQGANWGWVVAAGALHSIDIKTGQLTTLGRIAGLSGKDVLSIAVAN